MSVFVLGRAPTCSSHQGWKCQRAGLDCRDFSARLMHTADGEEEIRPSQSDRKPADTVGLSTPIDNTRSQIWHSGSILSQVTRQTVQQGGALECQEEHRMLKNKEKLNTWTQHPKGFSRSFRSNLRLVASECYSTLAFWSKKNGQIRSAGTLDVIFVADLIFHTRQFGKHSCYCSQSSD